ncbi:hypothetical protein GE061_019292 [Apolygus lucorum]|uniref:Uncharacterized protein n=1 Tax=Apolygus lucorum TaxID=248454 RepID=A0A8S9XC56_APOLU|nr:hypothetical protein GE061_019292 [Apolygus lucorum]
MPSLRVGFVHSFPAIPTYNQYNSASAYYNPWLYNRVNPYPFQEEWEKFWSTPPINTNLGIQRTQTTYNLQSSQATSGSNANSGLNTHQGTNTHQGSNVGPSNYNGPQSGSSSTVNAAKRQPVFIQGARSNGGDAGSIYVPGN